MENGALPSRFDFTVYYFISQLAQILNLFRRVYADDVFNQRRIDNFARKSTGGFSITYTLIIVSRMYRTYTVLYSR